MPSVLNNKPAVSRFLPPKSRCEEGQLSILFHRLGPYHFARLKAVGKLRATLAIEVSSSDDTYAWDVIQGSDGFSRITLFNEPGSRKPNTREVIRRIASSLDKCKPVSVAIPGWSSTEALGALWWCLNRQVPAIVMSESTVWDERRVPQKEWAKKRIVGLCSAGFAGGAPHADYLVSLGMQRERVFLGYDAVDNAYFERGADDVRIQRTEGGGRRAEDRGQFELPERYFLASARFVEKKNLVRLLQAYARYRELASDAKETKQLSEAWGLVLLGDGPMRRQIVSQTAALNLQEFVQLPGFKQYNELPVYYGLASVFIHASTTEQWGLVVNEAMASGLPVLVSNRCGCSQDLVSHGVNGFTFDPLDTEELANLMLRLSHGSRVPGNAPACNLNVMGQASRNIISNWSPERFAAGLQGAVEVALEAPRPRAGLMDKMLLRCLLTRS